MREDSDSNHPHDGDGAFVAEFHFDVPDERWLEQVRDAEHAGPLAVFGDYELLSEVGRGGQGVVYLARDRMSGERAALKRLRDGALATPAARLRFDREFEAAASLDHHAIVRVRRVESDGQPILAMDWIDGVPVTRWVRAGDEPKPVRERVGMLAAICDAVHHAHQRGVIHRDLKPSNILVDAAGQPHILDFGLARMVDADAPPDPTVTATSEFIGTLPYASPEQLRRDRSALDVRSDVFALGVIGYEMLTGRMPHPETRSDAEALRVIDESTPRRPSTLSPDIDHDLDAIILRAIDRDPRRRYQSVDALKEDLDRYLRGEPVAARPPRVWDTLRSFLRRHRVAAAIGITASVLIVAAGIGAIIFALHLSKAQKHEHEARIIAEQMNTFLNEMLISADPLAQSDAPTAREVLDAASERLDRAFTDQPAVKAALLGTIGRAYLNLGLHDQAQAHLEEAAHLTDDVKEGGHAERAVALNNLAVLRYEQRRLDDAEAAARSAVDFAQRAHGESHPDLAQALNNLGAIRKAKGDLDEAEELYRRALEMRLHHFGENHADVAETLNNLAGVALARRNFEEAEKLSRRVLEIRRRVLGENHLLFAQALDNLAVVLGMAGRLDEALPLTQQALGIVQNRLDADHPIVMQGLANVGAILLTKGESEAALPYLERAYEGRRSLYPDGDSRTINTAYGLGQCLLILGRHEDAERILLDAHRMTSVGGQSDLATKVNDMLVILYDRMGRPDDAARFRDASDDSQ